MGSLIISLISAACIFGGVFVGLMLRRLLPEYHLSDESKDTIKVGAGMIATVCPPKAVISSLAWMTAFAFNRQ